jgi:hypothetical protein
MPFGIIVAVRSAPSARSAASYFEPHRQAPVRSAVPAPNKQLQRTVTRRRGDGTSAPFHYALVPRFTRWCAAAELRRSATWVTT